MSTDQPTASRPLPQIEVTRPSAERDADDVRAHLDGQQCVFCGVPGVEKAVIEWPGAPGRTSLKPVCGGMEHPDNEWYYTDQNSDDARFCERCGEAFVSRHRDVCYRCDPTLPEPDNRL